MKSLSRLALLWGLCASCVIAADSPKPAPPKPIPADRQEAISRSMIRLQSAQLQAVQASIRAHQAEDAAAKAQADYEADLDKLRKEFGAQPECVLAVDKTWQCPKEEGRK